MEAEVGTRSELNLDEIVQAAQGMTGLTELGEPEISEGLEVLIDSYNREANLRPDGIEGQRMALIGRIANRLGVNQVFTEHPEIFDQEIRGPIVIVGLPRTGTSKLHRMMAANPDLQSLPLWKIMNPAPMGPTPEGGEDPRIAIAEQVSAAMRDNYPDFFAGHPMIPRDPDEEIWMMDLVVQGMMPCYTATVPSYKAWAAKQDAGIWYAYLRKLLQMFQWQDGSRSDQWLLKAPEHLGHLALLFETFPEATVVHTHRDPVVAIASIAVLSAASRRMYTDQDDPHEAGQFTLDYWSNHLRAYVEQRRELEDKHPFVDVPYREIVGDTMGAIERVFEAAGVVITDAGREAMLTWESDNPQNKFGKHQYALDQVGLTKDQVRAAFPEYLERFGPLL
jgi:Sulfotransferase family